MPSPRNRCNNMTRSIEQQQDAHHSATSRNPAATAQSLAPYKYTACTSCNTPQHSRTLSRIPQVNSTARCINTCFARKTNMNCICPHACMAHLCTKRHGSPGSNMLRQQPVAHIDEGRGQDSSNQNHCIPTAQCRNDTRAWV